MQAGHPAAGGAHRTGKAGEIFLIQFPEGVEKDLYRAGLESGDLGQGIFGFTGVQAGTGNSALHTGSAPSF